MISMQSGVPQGGVLSPLFFNITMDYILRNTSEEINQIVKQGKILAYADDLVIITKPEEKKQIESLIKHLGNHGLHTNPDKCQYLWHKEDEEVSKLGRFSTSINYLGVILSYEKEIIIKSVKEKSKKSIKKIKKFTRHMPGSQQNKMIHAFYRTLLYYHSMAAIAVGEITFKDLVKI